MSVILADIVILKKKQNGSFIYLHEKSSFQVTKSYLKKKEFIFLVLLVETEKSKDLEIWSSSALACSSWLYLSRFLIYDFWNYYSGFQFWDLNLPTASLSLSLSQTHIYTQKKKINSTRHFNKVKLKTQTCR